MLGQYAKRRYLIKTAKEPVKELETLAAQAAGGAGGGGAGGA